MATKIDTTEYSRTYGHNPKGEGAWMFGIGRRGSWTTVSYTGSWTEAARYARRIAAELQADAIVVRP